MDPHQHLSMCLNDVWTSLDTKDLFWVSTPSILKDCPHVPAAHTPLLPAWIRTLNGCSLFLLIWVVRSKIIMKSRYACVCTEEAPEDRSSEQQRAGDTSVTGSVSPQVCAEDHRLPSGLQSVLRGIKKPPNIIWLKSHPVPIRLLSSMLLDAHCCLCYSQKYFCCTGSSGNVFLPLRNCLAPESAGRPPAVLVLVLCGGFSGSSEVWALNIKPNSQFSASLYAKFKWHLSNQMTHSGCFISP